MVFDGTYVRGIIDWDTARPSTRVWDLSYAVHQFVPFHPADDLLAWGWPYEPDRRRRLRLFLDRVATFSLRVRCPEHQSHADPLQTNML